MTPSNGAAAWTRLLNSAPLPLEATLPSAGCRSQALQGGCSSPGSHHHVPGAPSPVVTTQSLCRHCRMSSGAKWTLVDMWAQEGWGRGLSGLGAFPRNRAEGAGAGGLGGRRGWGTMTPNPSFQLAVRGAAETGEVQLWGPPHPGACSTWWPSSPVGYGHHPRQRTHPGTPTPAEQRAVL